MTQHWFRIALAHSDRRAPRLVAAEGAHAGEAIEAARHAVAGSWPIALERATGDDIPLGESVGKGHVVMLGDAAVTDTFQWPVGVLPGLANEASAARAPAHDLVSAPPSGGAARAGRASPCEGFVQRANDHLLVIEAQTTADHLTDVFMGLIERLPAADNLEIRVLDHFEDTGKTDVWLTSRVDVRRIVRFLDDHDAELFGNGHLELSIYVRKHKATLRLTEHKTIVWLADDHELEAEVERWLGELGVPRVAALTTVYDAPHFHYRPAKSRDRKKLADELYRHRLRIVDQVRARDTAG
jgi:hypothetical protein